MSNTDYYQRPKGVVYKKVSCGCVFLKSLRCAELWEGVGYMSTSGNSLKAESALTIAGIVPLLVKLLAVAARPYVGFWMKFQKIMDDLEDEY